MAQRVGIGNNYHGRGRRRKGYFRLAYGWTSEASKKSWYRRIGSDILMFQQKLWQLQIPTIFIEGKWRVIQNQTEMFHMGKA